MSLLFSVQTFIPYAVFLSMNLLVRSWSSLLLPPMRLMSSANCRSHMGLPTMDIDVWWSWSVFCMIFSRNKLNRMGESKHLWQTPTVVLKNYLSLPFQRTALLELSYRAWMAWTNPSTVLKLLRTCHRHACQNLSSTFWKSMKLWNRLRWHCRCFFVMTRLLKICSTVLRPGLTPVCSSAGRSSALALSQFRITHRMILLGWLIRLIGTIVLTLPEVAFFW